METEFTGVVDGPAFAGTIEEFYEKYRKCTQCEHWKIKVEEFSPHNSRPCGYQTACKSCRAANERARYGRKNPSMVNQLKKGLTS